MVNLNEKERKIMVNPEWLDELCEEAFAPDKFVEDLCERDTVDFPLEGFEIGEIPYSEAVGGMCHNACAYMVLQLQKWVDYGMTDIPTDKFWWCHGTVDGCDHSWVEYREDGLVVVIDLTLSQFFPDAPMLYIGQKHPHYGSSNDACFSDQATIIYLAETACG